MIIPIALIIMIWATNIMPLGINIALTVLLGEKVLWEMLKVLVKIAEIGEMRD